MKCQHTLHHAHGHHGWNNANAPILRIAPGAAIECQALDAADGQLTPQSNSDDLNRLDFARVNPVVGPIYIDGAAPSDGEICGTAIETACSVCGDLRISEIVDMPNWVVSFYFPQVVFSQSFLRGLA